MHGNGTHKLHDVTIQLSSVTGRVSGIGDALYLHPGGASNRLLAGTPAIHRFSSFPLPLSPASHQTSAGAVLRLRNNRFLPDSLQAIDYYLQYHCPCGNE
jgi:hypothetical protein